MKKTKRIFVTLIIVILIIFNLTTITRATSVKITKENLKEALENVTKSNDSSEQYEIDITEDIITIKTDSNTYKINYDLTDKPTFFVETEMREGMTYEEFKEENDKLNSSMIGYVLVANINEAKIEDALAYYFAIHMGNINLEQSEYTIVDDSNISEGSNETNNPKQIYASKFSEHVMEYINSVYGTPINIIDNKEGEFNTYSQRIEQKDVTATSCKLISTLIINPDADFSKLNGYWENITESIKESIINNVKNAINIYENTMTQENESAKNITSIPQTGKTLQIQDVCVMLILTSAVAIIFILITGKKYKNV